VKPGHVEIAGAGFGGLTAAAAFAQRGWSVRVHERSTDLRAAGAGIFIFENGLRVLRAIGALDEAIEGAHPAVIRETRDAAGRLVSSIPFTSDGRRTFTIVRRQLLEAIAASARRAGAEIVTGSEAIGADPSGALLTAEGRRWPADLVIGADGVNSRVRESLGLLRSRSTLGDGAIRVMIPRLPHEVQREESQRIVEHWSGKRRVLYVPCSREWVYLALTALLKDREGQALPLHVQAWSASFPHLRPLFERIGEGGRWDPFEVIRLHAWHRGAVAVVGDAAHALAPNLGQGGGCSMMNALGLAVAIEQEVDVPAALRAWERRERPLTEHTQRISSLYSVVGAWPDALRSIALAASARSTWMLEQRMRTARHIPTGT
jgi:2-polyprenyl-6-methoxyphenol hydroxylase-like FAD-dependent oxidoreductase